MTEAEIEAIITRLDIIQVHLETINGSVLTLLETSEDHKDKLEKVGLWQARWEGGLAASKFAVPLIVGLMGAVLGVLIGRGL